MSRPARDTRTPLRFSDGKASDDDDDHGVEAPCRNMASRAGSDDDEDDEAPAPAQLMAQKKTASKVPVCAPTRAAVARRGGGARAGKRNFSELETIDMLRIIRRLGSCFFLVFFLSN